MSSQATPERPTQPWVLRLVDWILIAAFLSLTFLLGVFPLKDTDFWFHLRTGDLIRETGRIPTTDLYTYKVPDAPWTDLHWVFQVGISWVYERGGFVALNLAKCAITCVAVFLLITARRREWPVWVMLLAWLPALLVLSGRMYVRPETLTLLYLSAFLAIVSRWDRWPALALALPLIQIAWVNSQGLFILGPIVLTFGLIDAACQPAAFSAQGRRKWRWLGSAAVLTGLACLVNPYFLRGALYPLELASTMRNPIFSDTIAELSPLPRFIQQTRMRNLPLQLHIATIFLGALSFVIPIFWTALVRFDPPPSPAANHEPAAARPRRKKAKPAKARRPEATDSPAPGWRLSPFRLLLFGAFTLLSWQATRNSHQFAAVVGAVTAWNFAEWAAAVRARRMRFEPVRPRSGLVPRLATLTAIAVVFALVASGWFYAMTGEGRTVGLGAQPLWYAFDAVKFAGRPEMPPRFLGFHNGTAPLYEYFHGPSRKVFADARLEVIGPALYRQYLELEKQIVTTEPASWERALDAAERPVVLVDNEHNAEVGGALLAGRHWRCVWFDPVATVFVHDSHELIVRDHGVDFAARHYRDPRDQERATSAELIASTKALINFASKLGQRGLTDRARPLVQLGTGYALRIVQTAPEALDGWKLLGQLESLGVAESPEPIARYRVPFDPAFDLARVRATYAFRRALATSPDDFISLYLLSLLFKKSRMGEAALPLLERLERRSPINQFQTQIQKSAAAERSRIVNLLGSEPPGRWENLSELDSIVNDLLNHGRVATAADVLEKAYPGEPRPWEVTDRLATLYLHLGDPGRARALWSGAASPPKPAVAAARVAMTHLVEADFERARSGYREALMLDPGLFEAHFGLAVLGQDAGDALEALVEAQKAVDSAPNTAARSDATAILDEARPHAVVPGDFGSPGNSKKSTRR